MEYGNITVKPGADAALKALKRDVERLLERHFRGDWGDVDDLDKSFNEFMKRELKRVLSVYKLSPTVTIWIVSEPDRLMTTVLLPSEWEPTPK